jgi:hypothetical protein
MKFECPHCCNAYSVAAARPGQKTRCIKCDQPFVVPDEVEAVLSACSSPPKALTAVPVEAVRHRAVIISSLTPTPMVPARPKPMATPAPSPKTLPIWPRCQLCGGWMHKKTLRRGIFFGIVVSFLLIGTGIVLCLTGIGIVIGIPLILLGLFWGGKKQKVLACRSCGAVIARV